MISVSFRIRVTVKTPSETSVPTAHFEIIKSWAPLCLDRRTYAMNTTIENPTGTNEDGIVSQAATFLSFKVGNALEDVIPSYCTMLYLDCD